LSVGALRQKPEDYFRFGMSVSVVAHAVLAALLIFKILPDMGDFQEPIIYSISIEGGKNLGGITQVPKDDKKSPVAPVKNVTAETKKDAEVKEQPKEKEQEKPQEPEDDAEVSVAEKKPTPKPTAQSAKPTPQPKPTTKATAAPTKKPDAKKDTKNQKSDGDEVDKRLQAGLQRYLGESTSAGGQGFGAGKVGGSGMGGGQVLPAEVIAYQKLVQARIKEAWRWYDPNSSLITQLSFKIGSDGVISAVRILKGSGVGGFDESVQRAIIKASPLPPPPARFYEQYFAEGTRITFDPRN
jgi:colicin import membrane protein